MNVNVNDTENILCPESKNQYIKPIFRVKKISAIISPTGEETIIPIQVLSCTKCDHIVSDIKE